MSHSTDFYLGTGMLLVAWICYRLAFAFVLIEPIRTRQRAIGTQSTVYKDLTRVSGSRSGICGVAL